jgi:hypothetical protein
MGSKIADHVDLRRTATPAYDRKALEKELNEHVMAKGLARCFDFHDYQFVTVSQGARGGSLVKCYDLLARLLKVAPCGLLLYMDAKQIIKDLARKHQMCNESTVDEYSSNVANHILIMLNHTRRIRHSADRFRQAAARCTTEERLQLEELSNLVQPALAQGQGEQKDDDEEDEEDGEVEEVEAVQAPPKRLLCERPSNVSLDTDGFPAVLQSSQEVLQSPEEAPEEEHEVPEVPEEEHEVPEEGQAVAQAMADAMEARSPVQAMAMRFAMETEPLPGTKKKVKAVVAKAVAVRKRPTQAVADADVAAGRPAIKRPAGAMQPTKAPPHPTPAVLTMWQSMHWV